MPMHRISHSMAITQYLHADHRNLVAEQLFLSKIISNMKLLIISVIMRTVLSALNVYKKMQIGYSTVYRVPKTNNNKIHRFFLQMNEHLEKINTIEHTYAIVNGDFNINVRNENNPITNQHIDNMLTNNLYICDTKTITRRATSTTIDHIFTNNITDQINLSYVTHDRLDHRIICIEVTNTKMPNTKTSYTVKKINHEKLNADLKQNPIQSDTSLSVNEIYAKFIQELQERVGKFTTTKTYTKLESETMD